MMKRRTFITLLGGAAAAWPLAARAQQTGKIRTIGLLNPGSEGEGSSAYPALFDALAELGWTEGKSVVFERSGADCAPKHTAEQDRA